MERLRVAGPGRSGTMVMDPADVLETCDVVRCVPLRRWLTYVEHRKIFSQTVFKIEFSNVFGNGKTL